MSDGAPRAARAPFAGRRVVLGVTGGIAAYKAVGLARDLTLAGAEVDVVLTPAATHFIQPLSFEALTGRSVHSGMYGPGDPLLHIRLAREADLVVIAPATADFIARAAAGMADDLLTAILLATRAPVLICPAMNDRMYAHPITTANVERLGEIGYRFSGPDEGQLAWGEGQGRGRMVEPDTILDECARIFGEVAAVVGRRVLVTAGPTREPIDPIRFIGNRSSGRMGFALASAAWQAGGDVTLISGPTSLPTPVGVDRVDVESAEDMRAAVMEALPSVDVLIMAAAVADFRPSERARQKIKKEAGLPRPIELERTVDILSATRDLRSPGSVVVGFALETESPLVNGARKLTDKALDLLVVNDATEPGAGFEVDTNRVTLLYRGGELEDLPLLPKEEVARRIIERVGGILSGRDR